MKDFTLKQASGSKRDKIRPTPKQNKWRDPFFFKARAAGVRGNFLKAAREKKSAFDALPARDRRRIKRTLRQRSRERQAAHKAAAKSYRGGDR